MDAENVEISSKRSRSSDELSRLSRTAVATYADDEQVLIPETGEVRFK